MVAFTPKFIFRNYFKEVLILFGVGCKLSLKNNGFLLTDEKVGKILKRY